MRYQRSSALFRAANKVLPGGVNSPVRAFKAVGGTPVFVKEAKGAYFTDEDGNRYIDFISSWGPLLFGHGFQPVIEAVIDRARKGTSFGMPTALETELAELVVSMVPNIDKVRFVNSGTEACMSAIRLARGYTGRDKIVKFAGCYHGHADAFLIQAGSGAVTFGSPNSPGVTQGTARDTLLAHYNDLASVEALVDANPVEIAAVILEPVAGNMGCIPPEPGFLEGLRELCTRHGILLIFDEVIAAFGRVGKAFGAERVGVTPDIITTAKGLTNGVIPMGAVLVQQKIYDAMMQGPEHVVELFHGYTYSGHPVAAAAGLATLDVYRDEGTFEQSMALEDTFADLLHSFADHDKVIDVRNFGLMGAIELAPRDGAPGARGLEVHKRCFWDEDLVMRNAMDVLSFSPFLNSKVDEMEQSFAAIRRVVDAID